ncbi:YybS family protein [Alkalicoccus chagannorensis]|uniref:YybS family protein n=1 Tax=Alkalicoccus chagannorensis TaxID=427072 RepID=UPI00041F9F49|nr:YybS family protein [Alkalicoccus chagannorensis]
MNQNTILRDGIMLSAVFLLLMLVSLFIPIAGLVLMFFVPVPMALFTYKYGWPRGAVAASVLLLLLAVVLGPYAPAVVLLFAVPGIVFGALYQKGEQPFAVYGGGVVALVSGITLTYVGVLLLTGTDPIEQFQESLAESLETTDEMMNLDSEEEVEQMTAWIDDLQTSAPAMFVIIGGVAGIIMQTAAAYFLRRRGASVPRFPPVREWSLPKPFIWYYLAVLILSFINISEGQEGMLHTVSANLSPVMEGLMLIQGIAFIFFFCHWKGISKAVPVLAAISLLFIPFLVPIVRILGIIDLGFDLRTRLRSQE